MLIDVFSVFHDGTIDRVAVKENQILAVDVSIEYLRELFAIDGEHFTVLLNGCRRFVYRETEATPLITSLAEISEMQLGILSAEQNDSACRIYTDNGLIDVECESCSLWLDYQTPIELDAIKAKANEYWDRFGTD